MPVRERSKRRMMTSDLYLLNKEGWIRRNGITFLAGDYIKSKIRDYINDEYSLSKFLTKIKSGKIIVGNKDERDNIIALLNNYDLNPTVSKFVLLKDD